MANIEEARYQVLMSADGKELVQARYAVRNNQRNFVKVTLPAGATVWSVSLAGRPIRPGQSPDGSLLLPLEKSRGGDDAPAFAVEILYLTKAPAWNDKGREKVTLPALDLPISRTGLLLYYPPLFRVSAEPGTFHMQEYQNPVSAVLVPPSGAVMGGLRCANAPSKAERSAGTVCTIAKHAMTKRRRKTPPRRCSTPSKLNHCRESNGHCAYQCCLPRIRSIDIPGFRTYQRESVSRCRVQLSA